MRKKLISQWLDGELDISSVSDPPPGVGFCEWLGVLDSKMTELVDVEDVSDFPIIKLRDVSEKLYHEAIDKAEKNVPSYHQYRTRFGHVYFIACEGFVKIGFTSNEPRGRLSTIQSGNPFPCSLIGIKLAPKELEKELHEKFRKHKVRGEWFHLCEEIRDYIKTLSE